MTMLSQTAPADTLESLAKRLQLLEDENAIRDLSFAFADAANRVDADAFRALWTPDGAWTIGPPISKTFSGQDAIADAFTHLLGSWDYFIQKVVGGVVMLDGDRATARFYVNEEAQDKQKVGNYNLLQYVDELQKIDGKWHYHSRSYDVVYLDQSPRHGQFFALQPVLAIPL